MGCIRPHGLRCVTKRYWNDYGYWSAGYSYRNGADVRSDSVQVYKKIPKCVRTVNVDSLMQVSK